MKFLTLFAVALLAVTVTAASTRKTEVLVDQPAGLKNFTHAISQLFEYVMKFIKQVFPAYFYNAVHQYYEGFQKVCELIPNDLYNAAYNVFNYFPTFSSFYTPQFAGAIEEFFHAFDTYYYAHPFYTTYGSFVKSLPKITEIVPMELFTTVGKYLEHVPFFREVLKQWLLVLEQLLPHVRQI